MGAISRSIARSKNLQKIIFSYNCFSYVHIYKLFCWSQYFNDCNWVLKTLLILPGRRGPCLEIPDKAHSRVDPNEHFLREACNPVFVKPKTMT